MTTTEMPNLKRTQVVLAPLNPLPILSEVFYPVLYKTRDQHKTPNVWKCRVETRVIVAHDYAWCQSGFRYCTMRKDLYEQRKGGSEPLIAFAMAHRPDHLYTSKIDALAKLDSMVEHEVAMIREAAAEAGV